MRVFKTLMPIFLPILAAPAAANDAVVAGADFWSTPADGSTFYDFAQDPIPAGFFCRSSASLAGVVTLHGVTLATVPANTHGRAATRVARTA